MDIKGFLEEKPKNLFGIVILFFLLILTVIYFLYSYSFYDTKNYKAKVSCLEECFLETDILTEDLEFIKNGDYIEIDKTKFNFEIHDISEENVDYLNMISYNTILLKISDYNLINNYSIKIKILGDKERAVKKILKLLI